MTTKCICESGSVVWQFYLWHRVLLQYVFWQTSKELGNKSFPALFYVQRVNHITGRHLPYVVTPSTEQALWTFVPAEEKVLWEISTTRRVVAWKFRWKTSTTMFTFAFSSPAFNNRFINILWPSPGWISVQEISFKHFGISITIQFPDRKPLNDDSLNFTPSTPRVWSLSLQSRQRKSFPNVIYLKAATFLTPQCGALV